MNFMLDFYFIFIVAGRDFFVPGRSVANYISVLQLLSTQLFVTSYISTKLLVTSCIYLFIGT